jgi:hypothetical protein
MNLRLCLGSKGNITEQAYYRVCNMWIPVDLEQFLQVRFNFNMLAPSRVINIHRKLILCHPLETSSLLVS